MNKQLTIYIDGKYIKTDARTIEAFTPGVFKALGVFETMLAVGTKVFNAKEHLGRLHRAFKGVKVTEASIERIVALNAFDISRVRVVAWRQGSQKHVAVMALKYDMPGKKAFKVCLIKTNHPANAKGANRKSLDYKLFADAYRKARAKGFDDALLINEKGSIFEASRANVFWVKDGVLYTPPLSSGCLNGIMRQQVIKQAKQLKISFKEKDLLPDRLKSAEAMFLTNSLVGIRPVKLSFPFLPR